jgi:hypothetical protein
MSGTSCPRHFLEHIIELGHAKDVRVLSTARWVRTLFEVLSHLQPHKCRHMDIAGVQSVELLRATLDSIGSSHWTCTHSAHMQDDTLYFNQCSLLTCTLHTLITSCTRWESSITYGCSKRHTSW